MPPLHLSAGGLISKKQKRSPHFYKDFAFLFYLFLFFCFSLPARQKPFLSLPEAVRGQSPVLYNPAPSTFRRRCKAHDRKPIRSTPCGRHAAGKTQDIPRKFPRRQETHAPSPAIFLRSAFHSRYSYHIAFRHPVHGGSRSSAYSDATLLLLRSA